MVVNIGALKSGEHDHVLSDIKAVVQAAGPIPVKVLETSMLEREEKSPVCCPRPRVRPL